MSELIFGNEESRVKINFEIEENQEKKKFRGVLKISAFATGNVLDTIIGKEWPTIAECRTDIEKTLEFLKSEIGLEAIH